MKQIILMLMLSAAIISCKNSEEKNMDAEQTTTEEATNADNLKAFKGDYIDSNGALVLMGNNFIYGVKRNEISDQLSKQVAAVKTNDYDMVNVVVRGIISENNDSDSEWEEVITIKEILRVSDKPSEADIKFEESAKKN